MINVSAKKPSTTLGMPARISRIGLMVARARGRGVLGEVDRATPARSGVAMSIAITVTMSVPMRSVVMSKMPRRGNQPIPDELRRGRSAARKSSASTEHRQDDERADDDRRERGRRGTAPRTVRSRRCRRALPRSEMPAGRAARGLRSSVVRTPGRVDGRCRIGERVGPPSWPDPFAEEGRLTSAASQAARDSRRASSAGRFTYGTVSRTVEMVPSAR